MVADALTLLARSTNEAADDVLLDALRLGGATEQPAVLRAILDRANVRSTSGVVELYDKLPDSLQRDVLRNLGKLYPALRDMARSDITIRRLAAINLIGIGHAGKLAYLLAENISSPDETIAKAASASLSAMARWVARSVKALQADHFPIDPGTDPSLARRLLWNELSDNRTDIEEVIARGAELLKGNRQQEMVDAVLTLFDNASASAMTLLNPTRGNVPVPLSRRLQLTPEAEHVPAFLLSASRCGIRHTFGVVFAKLDQTPQLEALLRRTHWLADHQLQLCVRQTTSGAWCDLPSIAADALQRPVRQVPCVASWITASGLTEAQQDDRLAQLAAGCADPVARARLLRRVIDRPAPQSTALLRLLVNDADPYVARIAVRALARAKPRDLEQALLPLLNGSCESVRRVISRLVGQNGFDVFWERFDKMDRTLRQTAGRAMLKLLPDAIDRLRRHLTSGPPEQRVRALQIVQELDLTGSYAQELVDLCAHSSPRVRSKAVMIAGQGPGATDADRKRLEAIVERAASDPDSRVRANAIEVMETRGPGKYVEVLIDRARSGQNRERANAIKALNKMNSGAVSKHLQAMLRDPRPEHRISAMWLLRRIAWWKLVTEVARLAKEDEQGRVRRYAMGVLQTAVGNLQTTGRKAG
jgi:HEAT repeat protein